MAWMAGMKGCAAGGTPANAPHAGKGGSIHRPKTSTKVGRVPKNFMLQTLSGRQIIHVKKRTTLLEDTRRINNSSRQLGSAHSPHHIQDIEPESPCPEVFEICCVQNEHKKI